jgi:hypothetical protein
MFTYRTIPTGERAALWDKTGGVTYVDGPRRLWLKAGQHVQPLKRHAAAADQYLVVRHKDGTARHLHGPAAVWFDPVVHESVEARQALVLDANEAVVIYAQEDAPRDAGAREPAPQRVTRRILRGPSLFMPAPTSGCTSSAGTAPTRPRAAARFPARFTSPSCASSPTRPTSTSRTSAPPTTRCWSSS